MQMNRISVDYYLTPFGELLLGAYNSRLCICDWKYRKQRSLVDARITEGLEATMEPEETEVIVRTKMQLEEYFQGKRKIFDIPLLLVGTDFQKRVWEGLQQIPFGGKETYAGLAARLGDVRAIRAVANANGANALSILVPCHRIVGANGEMVGYAGGITAKKRLLDLEGKTQQLQIFSQAY